jgi:hypothetical protein
MPSRDREREALRRTLIKLLGSRSHRRNQVVDLGSGWGGLLAYLSRPGSAPELETVEWRGIERSWLPWLFSRLLLALQGMQVRIHQGNFLQKPLNSDTIYLTYLSGPAMQTLRRRFEEDQPRGGALISLAFAMPGWTPDQVLNLGGGPAAQIYLYEY